MSYRVGSGYKASTDIQISVANQEILPSAPEWWTVPYSFYKLSFVNNQDCHIIINNDGEPKFLRVGGFSIEPADQPINSLKIIENGITFHWWGAY